MEKLSTYSYSKPITQFHKVNVRRLNDFIDLIDFDYKRTYKINCYAIVMFTDGVTKYVIDFNTISLQKGDVLFISPGQAFNCLTPRRASGTVLLFPTEFFSFKGEQNFFGSNLDLYNELSQYIKLTLPQQMQTHLGYLLELIEKELNYNQSEGSSSVMQHLIASFLLLLSREMKTVSNSEVIMAERNLAIRYKSLVEQNISIKNNVEYFCEKMKISKSTLQKATKYTFQKTPKDIIEDVILLEAKRMLAVSENRIQEIAYYLGFNEATNFTKFFKRNIGYTPDIFRKSLVERLDIKI